MTENLIKCPQCKELITKWAKRCKHCNADLRSRFAKHPIWTLIIIAFFIYTVLQAHKESSPEYQAEQQAQQTAIETKTMENRQKLSKLKITKSEITEWLIRPMLKVTIKNESWKDIDGAKIRASFQNNFKENVYSDISREEFFDWIVQEVLKNWETRTFERQLSLYENATIIKSLELREVHFVDWETVTLDL